jgi:DNA-binding transcriptional ArsR family regulator
MFEELDPVLHSQLRLAIMSVLISVEAAEFNFLLDKTGATRGNLSVQITRLSEAGYVEVMKSFRKNYPLTTCKITTRGIEAFEKYVRALEGYLKKGSL